MYGHDGQKKKKKKKRKKNGELTENKFGSKLKTN